MPFTRSVRCRGTGLRRSRPARPAASHACGRVRVRRCRGCRAADRRHGGPGPPPTGKQPGRRAFVSGKRRQNTKKATVITDGKGRTLWTGAFRPGRMHDQTALKTEGTRDLFEQFPAVRAKVDAGYLGLARDFPNQVEAPPKKPGKDATPEELAVWEEARHQQSSERICVEHGNAEHKQWRPLQRWIGRREYYNETHLAIAGLVPDRAAER